MRELEREPTDRSAPERALPPIAVIGRGRVGGSIVTAAEAAGLATIPADRETAEHACGGAGVALLCVPDGEIAAACETISGQVPPLRFVGHVSGATDLAALEPAERAGAATFSLHPLQTIPDPNTPLAAVPAAIAGSTPEALVLARELAASLGMTPFEVPERARAAYHAAASIASNFLVALEESATGLLDAAGIDGGRNLLAPLVLTTAANWSERGAEALTGPIARGDEATVSRHLEALRTHAPDLLPLYEALAERTREVAASGVAASPPPAGSGAQ